MGYIHETPAWAGPLVGAKDRRTYWGVVPLEPDVRPRGLPPHPDDVPLPATFGDWYDTACGHLWRAEQADLGIARLVAGSVLVLLQLAGLVPVVWFVSALLPGVPVTTPDPMTVRAGGVLLAVTWTGWFVYRRRWNQAWALRKAWSWAIYDPRVRSLPVRQLPAGQERDIDTDPEATDPYRARWFFRIGDRPFTGTVFIGGGHTDRARRRESMRLYLPLIGLLAGASGVATSPVWWDLAPGQYWLLLVAFALAALPPFACSQARYYRRVVFAQRIARADVEERHRWMGWQLLRGGPGTDALSDSARGTAPDSATTEQVAPDARAAGRAALDLEQGSRSMLIGAAAFFFGVFGLVGVLLLLRDQAKGLTFLSGLAFLGVVCLALLFWNRSGQQEQGRAGTGFVVRVEPPRDPHPPTRPVPPGDMVLTFADGRAHLIPLDDSVPELDLDVTALISGFGQLMRDGKQWLVLPDDTHVAITCSDYVGLREAAAAAGITVVHPGPQPV